MTRAEQILKIKVFLDEIPNGLEGLTVTNDDPKPLDYFIDQILDLSCDEVLKVIPNHLLTTTSWTVSATISNGVATIVLPGDYVKLAKIKFASWTYPVEREISEDNPLYELQLNPYTRGGKTKPVFVRKKGLAAEAYTVITGDTATATYIAKRTRTDGKIASFDDSHSDYLGWYAAAKLCDIFNSEKASAFCAKQLNQLILQNSL